MSFQLHPQLEQDTHHVINLPLCEVRLMDDVRFPWLILVPRQSGLRELHALNAKDSLQLWQEINHTSARLEQFFAASKMNVAALGNLVPQLHIHVIARFETDDAWPAPVWGLGSAQAYADDKRDKLLSALVGLLEDLVEY